MENHKIPLVGKRCPKGYRIHKPTNMCEFFGQVENNNKPKPKAKAKPKTQKKSPVKTENKKPRCKNGTRRNPKTGNCEPK